MYPSTQYIAFNDVMTELISSLCFDFVLTQLLHLLCV